MEMNRAGSSDASGAGLKYNQQQQKQRIKDMLRDSIRVLCQNTVAHNAQLSIEALIGITVDNGDDVILVSIHEIIGRQSEQHVAGSMQCVSSGDGSGYTNDSAWIADGGDNQESTEYLENEGDYDDGGGREDAEEQYDVSEIQQQFGITTTRDEMMSVVTYNPNRSVSHPRGDGMTAGTGVNVKTEMFSGNLCDYYAADESSYGEQNVDEYGMPYSGGGMYTAASVRTGYSQKKPAPLGAPKHQRSLLQRGRGGRGGIVRSRGAVMRRQRLSMAGATTSLATANVENFSDGADDGSAQQQQPSSSQGSGGQSVIQEEVAHITLYTCSRCGVQMRNRSSFMRHKRSHEGIVYRCDGCGKILSRSDHLVAHRRRCPASQSQLPVE